MSVGFSETTVEIIELPTIPDNIPYAFDDCSLAFSLGFRNKVMWHMIENWKAMYKVHRIPKKIGYRIIHEPNEMMMLLLQQLHVRYLIPLQNELGDHVTAYRKGLSCRHAVLQHIPPCEICDKAGDKTPKGHDCPRKGLYVHMDLKDFFSSTSRAMIRSYFVNLGYNHDVASLLANLLTVTDFPNPNYKQQKKLAPKGVWVPEIFSGVPQGSPASGAICNLVADKLIDCPIMNYLERKNKEYGLEGHRKWVYTRYCDDLCFTCGRTFTLEETEQFIADITSIVHQTGYRINKDKTRRSHGYYGRRLLGTIFNQKPNIPAMEYRNVRAITHNCLVHGFDSQAEKAGKENGGALQTWLRGKINYMNQINPYKGAKLLAEFNVAVKRHKEGVNA